jgi:hypothetical protein
VDDKDKEEKTKRFEESLKKANRRMQEGVMKKGGKQQDAAMARMRKAGELSSYPNEGEGED